ncbi:MAG: 3-isopropylmalate dehydrogenase [Bowdeniella nasicola]|nr:3-isopropylmalate dehydrogenase [Bowdeniella nasicola]
MSEIDIAVIGGDGIGPEITDVALQVLTRAMNAAGLEVRATDYDLGARRYHRTGEALTDADLTALSRHDAILLGAIGDPSIPAGVLERDLLLRLRFAFDHYANVRPARTYPGTPVPIRTDDPIDFIVVREGTEGLYCGNGGTLRAGTSNEVATETSLNTAFGVERIVRYAFEVAARRERKHLTLVHKENVLVHAGSLWRRIVTEVAAQYPKVTWDYCHIDAATIYLVSDPQRFDVIVTDNLFGDILTDEAGAITGGVGLAASGNINPDGTYPSMFEPVHGSAPDIAGKGIADPIAAIASGAMLAHHLGYQPVAEAITAAATAHLAHRGNRQWTTSEVAADVLAQL